MFLFSSFGNVIRSSINHVKSLQWNQDVRKWALSLLCVKSRKGEHLRVLGASTASGLNEGTSVGRHETVSGDVLLVFGDSLLCVLESILRQDERLLSVQLGPLFMLVRFVTIGKFGTRRPSYCRYF